MFTGATYAIRSLVQYIPSNWKPKYSSIAVGILVGYPIARIIQQLVSKENVPKIEETADPFDETLSVVVSTFPEPRVLSFPPAPPPSKDCACSSSPSKHDYERCLKKTAPRQGVCGCDRPHISRSWKQCVAEKKLRKMHDESNGLRSSTIRANYEMSRRNDKRAYRRLESMRRDLYGTRENPTDLRRELKDAQRRYTEAQKRNEDARETWEREHPTRVYQNLYLLDTDVSPDPAHVPINIVTLARNATFAGFEPELYMLDPQTGILSSRSVVQEEREEDWDLVPDGTTLTVFVSMEDGPILPDGKYKRPDTSQPVRRQRPKVSFRSLPKWRPYHAGTRN